jgi:hypothetical protein
MNFDFDMSALNEEFQRVTTDKKPGAVKKTGTMLDKFVKMPKGDGYVSLRLLPPLTGQKLPYAACRVHNMGTPERASNLYCGRTLQGRKWVGDCFLCEYYNHLYRLADAARAKGDETLADQLVAKAQFIKPQEKYYYNAIVKSSNPPTGQTEDDGPLIYSCGVTLHTFILEAVLGNKEMDKDPKGNVFHPKVGRDLKIVKKMKPGGKFPDYSGCEWKDVSVLSKDDAKIQTWLSNLNDVFALRKVLQVDEMQRAIRIFEGKETDPRKSFDASFLDADSKVSVVVPDNVPVSTRQVQNAATQVQIPDVDDGDNLVDDDFANSVRAAIGATE